MSFLWCCTINILMTEGSECANNMVFIFNTSAREGDGGETDGGGVVFYLWIQLVSHYRGVQY